MNYTRPVYRKSYSLRQFIVPDSRYETPLKYLPLVFNRKPARFGGWSLPKRGQQTNDSSSFSTARDAGVDSCLIMWSSRCRPVSFNDTSPAFSDVCLRSTILHLRSVMFVYVQRYFTSVQRCLSTFNDTLPAFSDVCLRSIILHLRSTV